MKTKSLATFALAMTLGIGLYSCSQDEMTIPEVQETVQETYTYTMHLNCAAPTFDAKDSRAVSYSWSSGDKLYLAFTTNSSTIQGVATYQTNGEWKVETTGSLSTTTSEMNVNIRYFTQPGAVTNSTVALSETSALYEGAGKYTQPSNGEIFVNGTVAPSTWRMRFSGSQGTRVALNANSNDIEYYYEYSRTSNLLRKAAKDVVLQVQSDGYTPYIYGSFTKSGDCKISVSTDKTYTCTFNSNNLQKGQSGYMNLPTASNHVGWETGPEPTTNCTVRPNYFVSLSNGYVTNFTVDANVDHCYYVWYSESEYKSMSENEIIEDLKQREVNTYSEMLTRLTCFRTLDNSTQYYFCTVAYDKEGRCGGLFTYPFKTKSAQEPKALISNFVAYKEGNTDRWRWATQKINNVAKYYMVCLQADVWYNDEDIWNIWSLYQAIKDGDLTNTYTEESTSWNTTVSNPNAVLYTWALNSAGELSGEVPSARASIAANSNSRFLPNPVITRMMGKHDASCDTSINSLGRISKENIRIVR